MYNLIKQDIEKNVKEYAKLIKEFLEVDKPDTFKLWAIWNVEGLIMQDLKKLHRKRGGTGEECSLSSLKVK